MHQWDHDHSLQPQVVVKILFLQHQSAYIPTLSPKPPVGLGWIHDNDMMDIRFIAQLHQQFASISNV